MTNFRVNSIKEKFLKALKLHQGGDFKNAEMSYKKILVEHPNEIDTLHNLSMLAIQTNKPDIAVKFALKDSKMFSWLLFRDNEGETKKMRLSISESV